MRCAVDFDLRLDSDRLTAYWMKFCATPACMSKVGRVGADMFARLLLGPSSFVICADLRNRLLPIFYWCGFNGPLVNMEAITGLRNLPDLNISILDIYQYRVPADIIGSCKNTGILSTFTTSSSTQIVPANDCHGSPVRETRHVYLRCFSAFSLGSNEFNDDGCIPFLALNHESSTHSPPATSI